MITYHQYFHVLINVCVCIHFPFSWGHPRIFYFVLPVWCYSCGSPWAACWHFPCASCRPHGSRYSVYYRRSNTCRSRRTCVLGTSNNPPCNPLPQLRWHHINIYDIVWDRRISKICQITCEFKYIINVYIVYSLTYSAKFVQQTTFLNFNFLRSSRYLKCLII